MIGLFSSLDRLGPGNAESLRWALGVAGIGVGATVLDAGCGTGADLGVLQAAVPQGRVIGLDAEPAFVARAQARFPRLRIETGDMADPPGGPFDMIWSAGAVYNLGVTRALTVWRDHLQPAGKVAFSDLRWRTEAPPEAAVAFWKADGVTVSSAEALEQEVVAAGYRVLGARWLGTPGWASYYGPLEVALDGFTGDPGVAEHLRAEIALWRTHGVSYGYRLIVCEPV